MTGVAARGHAALVAIEQFSAVGNPASGLAGHLCAMAEWLVERGMPAKAITAFVAPLPQNKHAVAMRLDRLGVTRCEPTENLVHSYFDEDLANVDGDSLFVYWAGHGFVDSRHRTQLYYADSAPAGHGRHSALDLDALLTRLRQVPYRFGQQYVFVDACRRFAVSQALQDPVGRDFSQDDPASACHQSVLYAVPEGVAATLLPGAQESWFSQELQSRLGPAWPPDMSALHTVLRARAEREGRAGSPMQLYRRLAGEGRTVDVFDGKPETLADRAADVEALLWRVSQIGTDPKWSGRVAQALARRYPDELHQWRTAKEQPGPFDLVPALAALHGACAGLLAVCETRVDLFPPRHDAVVRLVALLRAICAAEKVA